MNNNPSIKYPANIRVQLVREQKSQPVKIACAQDADKLVGKYLRLLDKESVFALYLDSQNQLLGVEEISRGTLTSSLIDPRDIVKSAILIAAPGVIMVHNHPSGCVEPSPEDIQVTSRIREACALFNITLLDHIIIGDGFKSILHQ